MGDGASVEVDFGKVEGRGGRKISKNERWSERRGGFWKSRGPWRPEDFQKMSDGASVEANFGKVEAVRARKFPNIEIMIQKGNF